MNLLLGLDRLMDRACPCCGAEEWRRELHSCNCLYAQINHRPRRSLDLAGRAAEPISVLLEKRAERRRLFDALYAREPRS